MTHSRSKPRPPCPPLILIYPLNESETCLWHQKPGYQMEMAVFNSLDSSDRLNHHRRSCRLRHRRPSDHQHPCPCCHLVGRSNLRGCCYCYPKRCEDTLEVRFDNLSRAKYIKDGHAGGIMYKVNILINLYIDQIRSDQLPKISAPEQY